MPQARSLLPSRLKSAAATLPQSTPRGNFTGPCFQLPLPSPRKIAGMLLPLRSGGAMRSGNPSPFISATASEFRHEPVVGNPDDEFSNRIVVVLTGGSTGTNSDFIFLR